MKHSLWKRIICNIEEIVASIFLLILLVLTITNISLRFLTGGSLIWIEEVSYGCFAWVIFLGASGAYKRCMHSSIDLVIQLLPKKLQIFMETATYLLLLVTLGSISYYGYVFSMSAINKMTPVLKIPYTYIDLSVFFGAAFMCIHTCFFIRDIWKGQRPWDNVLGTSPCTQQCLS